MKGSKELILMELTDLVKALPEQRVGQIIHNYIIAENKNKDIFYLEDMQLLASLQAVNKRIGDARLERRLKKALDNPRTREQIFEILIDEELI